MFIIVHRFRTASHRFSFNGGHLGQVDDVLRWGCLGRIPDEPGSSRFLYTARHSKVSPSSFCPSPQRIRSIFIDVHSVCMHFRAFLQARGGFGSSEVRPTLHLRPGVYAWLAARRFALLPGQLLSPPRARRVPKAGLSRLWWRFGRHLLSRSRLIFTLSYVTSMVGTLWASLIARRLRLCSG